MGRLSKQILAGLFVIVSMLAGNFSAHAYQVTEQQIERAVDATGSKAVGALKEKFPAEYQGMISLVTQIVRSSGSGDQATQIVGAYMVEVRRNYAPKLLIAPDVHLKKILNDNVKILATIRDEESVRLCALTAAKGPLALPSSVLVKHFPLLDEASANVIFAMAAGVEMPVTRAVATQDDWVNVVELAAQNGMTTQMFTALGQFAVNDPVYCQSIIKYIEAVRDLEGSAGERVRANFAYAAAAS